MPGFERPRRSGLQRQVGSACNVYSFCPALRPTAMRQLIEWPIRSSGGPTSAYAVSYESSRWRSMRPRWHAAIVHENVSAMSGTDTTTLWERVHECVRESDRAITANDGVIATAGLLEGFSGAGAGDQLLLLVATAATFAGGLSAGGAK